MKTTIKPLFTPEWVRKTAEYDFERIISPYEQKIPANRLR